MLGLHGHTEPQQRPAAHTRQAALCIRSSSAGVRLAKRTLRYSPAIHLAACAA